MIVILILVAVWLLVVLVIAGLCAAAGRGDRGGDLSTIAWGSERADAVSATVGDSRVAGSRLHRTAA